MPTPLSCLWCGSVEARVTIGRPVPEVFHFYRDLENLPRFLGDVMAVRRTDPTTYRWTIEGPLGIRLTSAITVTEERTNELIRYESAGPPGLRARWTVRFADAPTGTDVQQLLAMPLGRLGRTALTLIGKPPAAEVEANLRRLKQLLETGKVTETEHAVAGKFDLSASPSRHDRPR
ncbi:SRPBCC family protein [Micromonospora sp. 15K316]|uniref:SRPBCC family protein n=1 Tax=Micromonospora sp. 15K316 TaxID=2530376 RepID=UPI0021103692|nr:SRPBCC family protein [Micromonospora sp. 15K316]